MSAAAFAAQRQLALQSGALSSDFFAEEVEIVVDGEPRTVAVKITHEQAGPRTGKRMVEVALDEKGTFDELERIQVRVSRDATFAKSLPTRPQPGATLVRDTAIDSDERPFAFAGEVMFEGDQDAAYVFVRPRRVTQGKGL